MNDHSENSKITVLYTADEARNLETRGSKFRPKPLRPID